MVRLMTGGNRVFCTTKERYLGDGLGRGAVAIAAIPVPAVYELSDRQGEFFGLQRF